MARKPRKPVDFSITEQFTPGGAPFDALLMDTAKVLLAQWLHNEMQGQSGSISKPADTLERYAQEQGSGSDEK